MVNELISLNNLIARFELVTTLFELLVKQVVEVC
jgi:hypothetical protein